MAQKINSYISAIDFISDPISLEFSGAEVQHKLLGPTDVVNNETFVVKYNADGVFDANRAVGAIATTGILSAPTVLDGFLHFTSGPQQVIYNPTGNVPPADQGAMEWIWVPLLSGAPATNQVFFNFTQAGSTNDVILQFTTAGNLNVQMRDNAAAIILSMTAAFAPIAGTLYFMSMNYNFNLNIHMFFVNGLLIMTGVQTGVNRLISTLTNLRVGNDAGGRLPLYDMADIGFYSKPRRTAPYADELPIITGIYNQVPLSVISNEGFTTDEIRDLEETSTPIAGGSVKHAILDIIMKYNDGAAWVASDGSEDQLNTLAEIKANLASLEIDTESEANVIPFLISDGLAQMKLQQTIITYDPFLPKPPCDTCLIVGYISDNCEDDIVGGKLIFTSTLPFADSNGTIISVVEEVFTNGKGYFKKSLPVTPPGVLLTVEATWDTISGKAQNYTKQFDVPDLEIAVLGKLVK